MSIRVVAESQCALIDSAERNVNHFFMPHTDPVVADTAIADPAATDPTADN